LWISPELMVEGEGKKKAMNQDEEDLEHAKREMGNTTKTSKMNTTTATVTATTTTTTTQ
jgi:hypothetical protein